MVNPKVEKVLEFMGPQMLETSQQLQASINLTDHHCLILDLQTRI